MIKLKRYFYHVPLYILPLFINWNNNNNNVVNPLMRNDIQFVCFNIMMFIAILNRRPGLINWLNGFFTAFSNSLTQDFSVIQLLNATARTLSVTYLLV